MIVSSRAEEGVRTLLLPPPNTGTPLIVVELVRRTGWKNMLRISESIHRAEVGSVQPEVVDSDFLQGLREHAQAGGLNCSWDILK